MFKSKLYLISLIAFFSFHSINLQAKTNIFACEPEWESLAKEIGKEKIKSFSATNAFQDPHYIRAKPSLINKIIRADLVICSGADLETAWLSILLSKAGKNIQLGEIGNIMAADYVETIDKPDVLDRSHGDVHEEGNPHLHLDPYNILIIAKVIKERLVKLDPKYTSFYNGNYQQFINKWQKSIKKWQVKAIKLKSLPIITYHKNFNYFIKWLKINEVISIESKSGITPSSRHLHKVLKAIESHKAKFIILSPFDPRDGSKWVSKKTGIKQLILPYTVGGNKSSKDLFSLYDQMIDLILAEI